MGLIIRTDFDQMIDQTDLDIILNADDHVLNEAIASSTREMIAYLGGRFDVSKMFFDVVSWSKTTTFALTDVVLLFAPAWTNKAYTLNDIASDIATGNVYVCIQTMTNNNKQPLTNSAFWTLIGSQNSLYKVILSNTGQNPNNATYFSKSDPRDPLLCRQLCDLVLYELHSRINPRFIPEFRIQRRDDVIKFLRDCADPRKNLGVNFPLPTQTDGKGFDISFGNSSLTTNHSY
jgi:hypothetical protein